MDCLWCYFGTFFFIMASPVRSQTLSPTTTYTATTVQPPTVPQPTPVVITSRPSIPTCPPAEDVLKAWCPEPEPNSAFLRCACRTVLLPNADIFKRAYNEGCSLFTSGFRGDYGEKMMNFFIKFAEDIQQMCTTFPAFDTCLKETFPLENSELDRTISRFVNVNEVGAVYMSWCELFKIKADMKCLSSAAFASASCSTGFIRGPTGPLDSLNATMEYICPSIGDMIRCQEIIFTTCHDAYVDFYRKMRIALSPECGQLAAKGGTTPLSAVLTQCGLTGHSVILPLVRSLGNSTNPMEFLPKYVNAFCDSRLIQAYLGCVEKYFPTSQNPIDKVFGELIDFEQLKYKDIISSMLCDQDLRNAVLGKLGCFMGRAQREAEVCGRPENTDPWEIFNDMERIRYMDGNAIRQTLCRPAHDIVICFVGNVVTPCNENAANVAKDMYFWSMRTDCYGARNGTIAEKVQEEKNKNGSVEFHTTYFFHLFQLVIVHLFLKYQ